MRGKERRALLLEALAAGGVDVDDLARRFEVSPSTVRRDLQRLSQDNAVQRTYGGAILAKAQPESTFGERLAANGAAKRAIAQAALELIEDGDVLILDAGSTVAAFGQMLRGRRLRIITNNLGLLPFLASDPKLELIVLGGSLRTTSMSTVGPLALEAMRRMTADHVFTSGDGVTTRGLCEASLDQVALKSAMMDQARNVVVLADSDKLGRADQTAWAPLPARWTLVTDASSADARAAELAAAGADVLQAPAD